MSDVDEIHTKDAWNGYQRDWRFSVIHRTVSSP